MWPMRWRTRRPSRRMCCSVQPASPMLARRKVRSSWSACRWNWRGPAASHAGRPFRRSYGVRRRPFQRRARRPFRRSWTYRPHQTSQPSSPRRAEGFGAALGRSPGGRQGRERRRGGARGAAFAARQRESRARGVPCAPRDAPARRSRRPGELLVLLRALELLALPDARQYLHLCLAPVLVICLGTREESGECPRGDEPRRRAAGLLGRMARQYTSLQLGQELLRLLEKAIRRLPGAASAPLAGAALLALQLGPRAIEALLLGLQPLALAARGAAGAFGTSGGHAVAAHAFLAVLRALRQLAAGDPSLAAAQREHVASLFGVEVECLALGGLLDLPRPGRGRKRQVEEEEVEDEVPSAAPEREAREVRAAKIARDSKEFLHRARAKAMPKVRKGKTAPHAEPLTAKVLLHL
ncbi:unnamed protein product [Effrenium voratum]|nr:unnamed protein product [Effrenium voratum]